MFVVYNGLCQDTAVGGRMPGGLCVRLCVWTSWRPEVLSVFDDP